MQYHLEAVLRALRSLSLGAVASAMLALTLVAFACGSSSVSGVSEPGRKLRWAALFALLAVAAARAFAHRRRVRLSLSVLVPAGLLPALALFSAGWSVDPELSVKRTVTLGVALAAAAALGLSVSADPALLRSFAGGLFVGACAVAVIGVLVLVAEPDNAMQWGSSSTPARYQGLGQNPNTMSMLFALVLPFGVWLAATASGRRRVGVWAGVALLGLSIFLSGSRGAILAAIVGVGALILLTVRGRDLARALVALAAALLVGFALMLGPSWSFTGGGSTPAAAPAAQGFDASLPPIDLNLVNDPNEIGRPPPGEPEAAYQRTLFSSSGRAQAWDGALREALERPLLGYGFGTEELVFIDRYYIFQGSRPENSYLGFLLQLGFVGLGLYLAIGVAAAVALRRSLRLGAAPRGAVAACAGVVAAGFVIAVFQSYVYSVGNVATVTFWTAAFLLAGCAAAARGERAR